MNAPMTVEVGNPETDMAVGAAADSITILHAAGSLKLTKQWKADGSIAGYDDAKNFRVRKAGLTGIQGFYKLLQSISAQSQCCVIRGQFIGAEAALAVEPSEIADHFRRINALYTEVAHHWLLVDIDGSKPVGIVPNAAPVAAIEQYIAKCLPECFQGASFVWQLSGSAGAPKYSGILKAHVFFWLETPYTGPQLTAWVHRHHIELDVSVLRRVQPNYTAAPVFDAGVADPIPKRMGFEPGWAGDTVPLEIDAATLAGAHEYVGGSDDIELIDPKTKPGLIGLFCRIFSMEEVIDRWLPSVFEFQADDERRLNFLQGGGSPGGAFVSGCREYTVNMHNSDPLKGRATNKWDLVRHYVHGAADEGADPLELAIVSTRPSQLAMMAMVAALPEVKAALREEKSQAADTWVDRVAAAIDQFDLREVATEIKGQTKLDMVALEQLAGLVQAKFKALGIKVPLSLARSLVGITPKGKRLAGPVVAAPGWAKTWSFITDCDSFFDLATKEKISERGFNARYQRNMKPFADPFGSEPLASHYALNEWHLPCLSHLLYLPTAEATFEMMGASWANTHQPDAIPEATDYKLELSDGWLAVETVKNHLRKVLPNRRERRLFASWLAHNVQNPGVKVRWAPYLQGYEGDGKSFFVDLLAAVMGERQIRTISGSTLQSNFTDWAIGYAVIAVEEMKQHGHDRHEVMNRIKPFITNGTVEIHPKGKTSYVSPNTANYIILSNFLDGAPIDQTSRRYMFLSSSVRYDELAGLNEAGYFKELFATLKLQPGAIRSWLLDFELDAEFDPDGRAPETDIRQTVIEMSRTETESLARDAIESGIEGVSPNAISSAHLTSFLVTKLGNQADVQTTRTNSLLTKLGFRLLGRHKWQGDKRRIWIKGEDRDLSQVKAELDSTLGLDFSSA